MSIASQITRINNNIAAAYTACSDKGATMPQTQNSDNLADTVANIPQGSTPTLQSKTVTPTTSQQSVTPDSGYDGLSDVTVNAIPLESKTITPTAQQQIVTPTAPNIGLSSVTVGAAPPSPTLITKQITANGTYTAEDDNADGYSEVTVAVPREITKLVDGTITEYIDDEVTAIAPYTFNGRTALTTCIVPNVRTIDNYAFRNTSALETVDFSSVETIGGYAFYGSLLNDGIIRFPNCTVVNEKAFRDMVYSELKSRKAIFPKLISIPKYDAFNGTTAHTTIHLLIFKQKITLGTYDASLFDIRNKANNPLAKFYVPQRYFDWYTTATNWSAGYAAYPNSIQTIEDNIDYLVSLGFDRAELLKDEEVPTT